MLETVVHERENTAEFRRMFRDYEDRIAVSNSRRAAMLAAIFMLAGCSLDFVVFPELAANFLLIRIVSFVLLGSIFLHLGRIDAQDKGHLISAGIALIPLIAICAMIVRTGGGNSEYYAGLSLVLVGLSLLLRWSFRKSLAMISICLAFYALSVTIAHEPRLDRQILFNNSYVLFVTSVFVVAGSFYYEKLRFREFALRTEVEASHTLLESQNRQLSELDEAKTHFFANISHELRTPLTIMLGITERLKFLLGKQQPADPKMNEMTQMLEQNGLRLLKLIDDLLDLVRFDTGHTDINTQPTVMDAHLDGLLLSLRHLAEQDRVSLVWECHSESERVMLDRDKFDKILLNLVINAIKFTPSRGVIEVKANVAEGRLKLTVEDTGVGIPPHVLPRIFERFWQVDTSSTRKFQGAGIGLALVRSLSQAMEGEIDVDSQLGVGTKFTVSFPIEAAAPATGDEVEEEPLKHGGKIADLHRRAAMAIPSKLQSTTPPNPMQMPAPPPMIGGRPSTARPLVLIADDEPDIRRFLRMQLEDVDVIEAADGAEAFQLAQQRQPQLALLDQMMPEMDGIEACRRIRENHTTRSTAIIILTARADEQTKLNALQAGANDFLTKPFSTAELGLRLANQLAMARIRREMSDLNSELQSAIEQIKENEVAMVRNEKLSSLGRMSAGIIHEINNPLNYATAGLHALATFTRALPDKDQPDFEDILKDIREGVERVSQIVIDLRQFTREDNGINGDADLTEVISRSQRMVGHQVGKEISFNLTAPPHAMIRGNGNQLVQVFVNFFQNSIDAIHERPATPDLPQGRIDVTIEPAGEGWHLGIRDNGVGIPPENLQKIFDPFFTSKDVGKGMGLGLSITHQILQGHGAVVEVDSRPGQYTQFRLSFPGAHSRQTAESELDPLH